MRPRRYIYSLSTLLLGLSFVANAAVAGPASAGIPGDVDGNGYVGGVDLTTVITNWGMSSAIRSDGDLNGDSTVSGPDYSEVISYWGSGTPPPELPSGIPEPATLGLLVVGSLMVLRRKS